MYTAVVRRTANGFIKTSKKQGGDLFLRDTRPANVATFFQSWPRHMTTFLCYGRSARAELKYPTNLGARALALAPRRSYGTMLVHEGDAKEEIARLASSKAEVLTYPQVETKEPAPVPAAPVPKKMTLHHLKVKHARKQPLSMLTAYDYPSARLADRAGADVLLVGDSVGMVVLGREDTTDVTMTEMVHHCAAAARGASRAMLIGDLPFGSCLTPLDAARNGVRLVKEGRVDAVKLEGGKRMIGQVKALVDAGVAVCGHIGLTPQSYSALGGYRVQGRTADQAVEMLEEAQALQEAGCFAIVLEMVPTPVAAEITRQLSIPTFGIGAGGETSGQVQVFHDVLGLYDKKVPKFARQFGTFEEPMVRALRSYVDAVDSRSFPSTENVFGMAEAEARKFEQAVGAPFGGAAAPAAPAAPAGSSVRPTANRNHGNGDGGPASQRLHSVAASAPVVVRSIAEWRTLQEKGALPARGVGFVPTMGALHAGHLSLVSRAQRENDAVAVSVFVNPKQFAPTEDLEAYPRPWEADYAKLTEMGADYVFAPPPDEMYPPHRPHRLAPFIDLYDVDLSTAEGAARPGFFRGVATVVTKLLNIIQPRAVYFGQKDGMQCVVVRRLIEDLNFNTKLVVGDTVREADGLAMSSRNVYLSKEEREAAPAVYAALVALRAKYEAGERSVGGLHAEAERVIRGEPLMELDYLNLASAVDGSAHEPSGHLEGSTLASIAVKIGTTRLIDNIILE